MILQSEIWLVDLNPTIGAEIGKTRPCLVVNDNRIGKLPSKIVVPITSWDSRYRDIPWMIKINPNETNGLSKASTIDTFQIRNLSQKRFVRKLGIITQDELLKVHSTITKTLSVHYTLN
jgi:mRNA interferase MazF